MSGAVSPNRNVPSINAPVADLNSLVVVTMQLRQGVESLGGMRGDPMERAATLNDLVKLGLVDAATLKAVLK